MSPDEIVEQLSELLCRPVLLRDTAGCERRNVDGAAIDVPVGGGRACLRIPRTTLGSVSPWEWSIIDAATYLLDLALSADVSAHRDRVLSALMDEDPRARRDALWEIRTRRWVETSDGSVDVVAVVVDDVSELSAVAFGRRLAATTHAEVPFVGVRRDAAILLASPATELTELSRDAERAAGAQGIAVRGVAVAACTARSADITDAIERAMASARLRAALPDHVSTMRAEELGGWLLVQSLPRSLSLLEHACPAAAALMAGDDPTQRETVETYLDVAGRAGAACERLHIHRTTLYYRLEHLPEPVRDALADGLQRSTLHIALKMLRLWDEEARAATATRPVPIDRAGERLSA